MFEIQTTNNYIEKKLTQLALLLKERGAYFDPALVLSEDQGNFSVSAKAQPSRRYWMKIPHNALIPFNEFALELQGDDIVFDSYEGNFKNVNHDIFEILLSLYNETGKIKAHKESSIWLQLEDKDKALVEHLVKARDYQNHVFIKQVWGDEDLFDEMVLLTFFMSRLVDCKLRQREGVEPVKCVAPFIEFLNHSAYGSGYDNLYNKRGGAHMGVRALPSFESGQEICTNYGYFDPLDLYLQYGFVYPDAPFVCSVPMVFDLGVIGKVVLKAQHVPVPIADIPEGYKDLGRYFPAMEINHTYKMVTVSHLLIPGESAPLSLRRILRFIVTQLEPDITEEGCIAYIYDIESRLVETNLLYFSHARTLFPENGKGGALDSLEDVFEICSKKINEYQGIVSDV